jgi:predicted amidophosphoribosyltransferase
MKNGKGSPHFFCEHCGAEVRRSADSCPSCGRSFASVRCPKCDFTGEANFFANGCPECGYSAHFDDSLPSFGTIHTVQKNAPLPFWVYVVTLAAFFAAVGIFFFHLTN